MKFEDLKVIWRFDVLKKFEENWSFEWIWNFEEIWSFEEEGLKKVEGLKDFLSLKKFEVLKKFDESWSFEDNLKFWRDLLRVKRWGPKHLGPSLFCELSLPTKFHVLVVVVVTGGKQSQLQVWVLPSSGPAQAQQSLPGLASDMWQQIQNTKQNRRTRK